MAAAVFAVATAIAAPAVATFTGASSTSASFTSATLAPASGVALTWTCPPGSNRTAQLAWTATPSTFADGYLVDRLDPSTGALLSSTRTTATAFTDSVPKKTNVRYRVTATAANWRSASIEVTGTAPAGSC